MKVTPSSFLHFVYPFGFPGHRSPGDPPCPAMTEGRMDRDAGRSALWQHAAPPREGLLCAAADYFDGSAAQASLWEIPRAALDAVDVMGTGTESAWTLTTGSREFPFRWHGVRLALFPQGVGLLTMALHPTSCDLADWIDFLHFARFTRREKVSLRIQRRVGRDAATGELQFQPYFPAIAGGLARHPDGHGPFQHLIEGLLDAAPGRAGSSSDRQDIYVPGQLIPYAALFVQDVPAGEREGLLNQIENFFRFHRDHETAVADPSRNHGSRWTYAVGQSFLYSLDGSAFVAFDPPDTPFFRQTLPANLASQYFFLFQLALFQRFALMKLNAQILHGWHEGGAGDDQRERTLRQVRDQLLAFTAGGYFSQVVQGQRQHRCYRLWQECFQTDELYQRTRQAVTDMQGVLSSQRDEKLRLEFQQLDLRLREIALILGPPALCLSFVGIASWTNMYLATGALAVGLALGWLAWRHVQRPRRPPGPSGSQR